MKKLTRTTVKRVFVVALITLIFTALPYQVARLQACTICIPYPERTLADRLLEKDEIILAREIEHSPYLFTPVEVIRGPAVSEPIKLFCDSSTRRKLQYHPDSAVVVARDGSTGEWQTITFADRAYQPFIRAIVQHGAEWGERPGALQRLHFFSKLLSSEHPQIQEQAYLEVGRAPYSMIRSLALDIPRQQIHEFLKNFRFIEWHSLYILFLGQSRHPEDRAYIRDQVELAARLGLTTNLAAWLTAFIETAPETGLAEIKEWYLSAPGRSRKELDEVMTSLNVLGSLQPVPAPPFPSRDAIVGSYAALLQHYPEMAARVAKDLAMWQVRAHVERLSEIRSTKIVVDPAEAYQLDYYLSMAASYPRPGAELLN